MDIENIWTWLLSFVIAVSIIFLVVTYWKVILFGVVAVFLTAAVRTFIDECL